MSMSRKKVFTELAENLGLVIDQIKSDQSSRPDKEVSLDQFWQMFDDTVKAIASECTKLCLAFSTHPVPSSAGCMSFRERVESAALRLVSVVYRLPFTEGQQLRHKVFGVTVDIVNAVRCLVLVVADQRKSTHQDALQCTGGVWELCDSVPNLPRNNKQVVLLQAKQTLELVKDALQEIEEEISNADTALITEEGDIEEEYDDIADQVRWTEQEKKVLNPSIGVIKVAKSALKKLHDAMKHGNCNCASNVSDYDVVCDRLTDISPKVDDVIEALYPPLSAQVVVDKTEDLMNVAKSLLEFCPNLHFVTENDVGWKEFLVKAVDHNWNKLQSWNT